MCILRRVDTFATVCRKGLSDHVLETDVLVHDRFAFRALEADRDAIVECSRAKADVQIRYMALRVCKMKGFDC